MSGMVKAKKYDWKDSNLALFGSDVEKNVKKESAETEEAWRGAGNKSGLQIWRIVKFKVTKWDRAEYGKFYNGDSYIVLNTYTEPDGDELKYDVHFWIGRYSTQDEYGTAAYKTVELDTLLDDKAVQHREVEGHESDLFKSYFQSLEILTGGADTGFRQVKPEEYKPRLLHFHGYKKNVCVNEVLRIKTLDSSDVFILDLGLSLYQWNGKSCNKDEKFKAVQFLQQLKSERGGRASCETLDEEDLTEDHEFYTYLDQEPDTDDDQSNDEDFTSQLLRVSNESGEMQVSVIQEGVIEKDAFDSHDVCIYDTGKQVFVWVGNGASSEERKNGMSYAHKHLMGTGHPLVPVSCVKEGNEPRAFYTAMAA